MEAWMDRYGGDNTKNVWFMSSFVLHSLDCAKKPNHQSHFL